MLSAIRLFSPWLGFTPGPPSPPPAQVADTVTLSGMQPAAPLQPGTPIPPDWIASWDVEAQERHEISSVARSPQGTLFVSANRHDFSDRKRQHGVFTAYAADGSQRWEYTAPDGHRIHSSLLDPQGRVVLMVEGPDRVTPGSVITLDADTGQVQWTREAPPLESFISLNAGPDGTLYLRTSKELHAVSPDGEPRWVHRFEHSLDPSHHWSAPDGTQIFACNGFLRCDPRDRFFYAVDASGRGRQLDLPEVHTEPLLFHGQLIFGGKEGRLYGTDLTTWKSWRLDLGGKLGTPVGGRDGRVYVQSEDGPLHAVDPRQGQRLWSHAVRGPFTDASGVAPSGHVYVPLADAELQEILPDGRDGQRLRFGAPIVDVVSPGDGRLYVWQSNHNVTAHDLQNGSEIHLPVAIDLPPRWTMPEVLPGGTLVFAGPRQLYQIPVEARLKDRDAATNSLLGGSAPRPPAATLEQQDGWIVIGALRVPVNPQQSPE